MSNIEGKAAVVTGSTRGIGFAIASALLQRGGRVMLCSRNIQEVGQTVEKLKSQYGGRVSGLACDVRSYDSVRLLFDEARQKFGALDILVNNAGIGSHKYVEEMPVEEWNATLETNLSGVFYCCRE